jgi:hypothetical protein
MKEEHQNKQQEQQNKQQEQQNKQQEQQNKQQEQQNKQQEQQNKQQAQQAQAALTTSVVQYPQRRNTGFNRFRSFAMSWKRIVAKVIIVLLVIVLVAAAVVAIHYSPCNLLKVIGWEKMYGKPQDYHAGCTPHYAFRGSHDYNLVNYKPPHLINMYPSRHNFIHDI